MKKLAFFTGTRAEWGLLSRVFSLARDDDSIDTSLIVTGSHLSNAYGSTINEIIAGGYQPNICIDAQVDSSSALAVCNSMQLILKGVGCALDKLKPDILVLLGDRYEVLAAASAAQIMNIPVAHLYGGEITEGAMDDAFRHAVTKLSHFHFTATEQYRQRVIQMGEDPKMVWNVGSLGVENALSINLYSERETREKLGLDSGRKYFVCTFHPVTLDWDSPVEQLRQVLLALEAFPDYSIIFTGSNADKGGDSINEVLSHRAEQFPDRFHFSASLGMVLYLSAVKYAACVVGNSSSGIVEAPSLQTAILDIGDREKGRDRSAAVLHCEPEKEAVIAKINKALSPEHHALVVSEPNPYQKQGTAASVVNALHNVLKNTPKRKVFHDISRKDK